MKFIRIRKSVIIAVALSGAIINAAYCVDILKSVLDPQYNNAVREIMISAAVLEIGWITLLVWLIFKPFERRPILLLTIVPILLGNIFHGALQFYSHNVSPRTIALNTAFGLLYSGLYVVAFIAGKNKKIRPE